MQPFEVLELLLNSNRAVESAIVALYNKQTLDEKHSEETRHSNKIGFNAYDARFGTFLARFILAGNHLNSKDIQKARNITMKYSKQLAKIANDRETEYLVEERLGIQNG